MVTGQPEQRRECQRGTGPAAGAVAAAARPRARRVEADGCERRAGGQRPRPYDAATAGTSPPSASR